MTPLVAPESVYSNNDWRRAYDGRFMTTSMQRMQEHVPAHVEQIRRTHAEKQECFRNHSLPNLTWMDVTALTHERSLHQRQPSYFADVGGPPRMGVHSKRVTTPLLGRALAPAMNITGKAGISFGK